VLQEASKVRLVIFDWAGTTIDHGSKAPVIPFIRAFSAHGVHVTMEEVREPMGLHKKDHIRALLQMPAVARRWQERHGHDAGENDIEDLYQAFMPLQLQVIDQFAGLVPGLLNCIGLLRQRGIAIGATTGYFRQAAARIYEAAARQGYKPDCCVCAEEVPVGRPRPWMIFRIMEALSIYPPASVVKVGDTVADIGEGLAAGAWSVGVLRTSNDVGCDEAEWEALPCSEKTRHLMMCREKLIAAGAHAVVETLSELPNLLDGIDARLSRSETP
jgi:phosphonoacetaldehyde hydrolase